MPGNHECLQLIENNVVPCRSMSKYGYDPITMECPLSQCEAKRILEDPNLFKKVAGKYSRAGPQDADVRELIFHLICPGLYRIPNVNFETAVENAAKINKYILVVYTEDPE